MEGNATSGIAHTRGPQVMGIERIIELEERDKSMHCRSLTIECTMLLLTLDGLSKLHSHDPLLLVESSPTQSTDGFVLLTFVALKLKIL